LENNCLSDLREILNEDAKSDRIDGRKKNVQF